MQDIGRVHGLEGAQGLVDEVLAVVVGQFLSANDTVHVSLHELLNEVDLGECFVAARLLNIEDRDNVFVVEVAEELHLTQRA